MFIAEELENTETDSLKSHHLEKTDILYIVYLYVCSIFFGLVSQFYLTTAVEFFLHGIK